METVKISSFVPDIRRILRDTNTASPHIADAIIHLSTKDAFRHLQSVRPEARYVGLELTDTDWPDDSELGDFSITFDARWRLGLVYYAAARCYEVDITDSVNLQLAQTLMQKADVEFQR